MKYFEYRYEHKTIQMAHHSNLTYMKFLRYGVRCSKLYIGGSNKEISWAKTYGIPWEEDEHLIDTTGLGYGQHIGMEIQLEIKMDPQSNKEPLKVLMKEEKWEKWRS